MESITTYIKEAFITKSNIRQARKANNGGWEPGDGEELFNKIANKSSNINSENAKRLEDALRDVELLPEGNVFKNKHLSNVSWRVSTYTIGDNGYTIEMKCTMECPNQNNKPGITTVFIPVWMIYYHRMGLIRQDYNVHVYPQIATSLRILKNIVNEADCEDDVETIHQNLKDMSEDIGKYLNLPVHYETWKI